MCMIFINDAKLPRSEASYLAFRLAFQETFERISLARQFRECTQDGFGYLTEVPFLSGVSPMVQLELLASTWSRHFSEADFSGTLLDEAVIYAACERAAWSLENESLSVIKRYLAKGPVCNALIPRREWSREMRRLHESLCADADFLLISQFEDLPPGEADVLKREWGIEDARLQPLFDCQERWFAASGMRDNLAGLLTPAEIELVSELLHLPVAAD